VVEVVEDAVVGLKLSEVSYPVLLSLYGETKKGKTYLGASFPNAIVIDFPPIKLGFGKLVIDQVGMNRTVGEGFRSLFEPKTRSGEIVWVPKIPGFDFKTQYRFVRNYTEFMGAIEHARLRASTIEPGKGRVWVVFDDTYRWRALEVANWVSRNGNKWPSIQQFGQITQTMQGIITEVQNFANVLLISRMVKNYDTGEYGPQVYPSGSDYLADASFEITTTVDESTGRTVPLVKIHSCGNRYACDPDFVRELRDPTPQKLLEALGIPKELW